MIKVLVVDDSAFMRREISKILESDPAIQVIGTLRNGTEVLSKTKELKPDVITLDIEMPKMDGITALKQVMAEAPCSVVMVSSLTTEGAEITIKALEEGAFDFVHKPSGNISLDIATQTGLLIDKIKTAAQAGPKHIQQITKRTQPITLPVKTAIPRAMPGELSNPGIVGIGVSTGGPYTLMQMLPLIKNSLNISILIAQHMPGKFTASLAKRLDGICSMRVKEAEDGEIVERGCVYIAQGGKHMKLTARNPRVRFIKIEEKMSTDINSPSVDTLFQSLSQSLSNQWLGIILTGMGSDGSQELLNLRKMGGHTIAEAEESCTVFGMPKQAIEKGAAEFVLPIQQIPEKIEILHNLHLF